MLEIRENCKRSSIVYLLFFLFIVLVCEEISATGNSKQFLRNNFSKEQTARNYYPASYKRFRRGYGIRDDSDFNQFSFGSSGSPDSFGTFRKGSVGGRKGASRTFSNRGFSNFGGPDAFLSPAASPDDDDEDERGATSIKFGGSSGGFSGFGNSSPKWGKQSTSAKGRSKGGIKKAAAAVAAKPTSINFGSESSRYTDRGGPQFSFGGGGGGGGGNPSFGGASPFGNTNNFLGSYGKPTSSFSSSGNSGSAFSGSKTAFSSGGDSFPNPFLNPGGGGGSFGPEGGFGGQTSFGKGSQIGGSSSSFGGIGNLGSFTGNVDELSGAKLGGPIKNFPDFGNLDLNAFLDQLKPTTTTKKPLRVISEEDKNKIFSGGPNEKSQEAEDESFIPISFGDSDRNKGFPNPFISSGIGKTKTPIKKELNSCGEKPEAPLNSEMRCTSYSGCRIDCIPNYQTPSRETRIYLKCIDGEWKIAGQDTTEIPDCEPICDPPCKNEGICLAPNLCNCPDNWEGPTCETLKEKKCSNKPPTPMNTRMFCGTEGCIARCIEDYVFEGGVTKLSFVCINGEWTIKNVGITTVPNCKPVCDPECQNGGICLAPNLCECTKEFRGPQCQYPISNCDPKKLDFNGGYNCSGENMKFGCKLWCPIGIDFTFPQADFYNCDYATGRWSPTPIPKCNYDFLLSTEKPFEHKQVDNYLQVSKPSSGTCFSWSAAHYKSFDGKVYSFESSCPYTLLQDATLGTFSVNLLPQRNCLGPKCQRSLKIFTEGDQYVLERSGDHPVLTYRDTSLAIPGQMNGVVSERVAHYVVLKLTGIGLMIKWDMQNLFIAEVSDALWNRTSGLCGRFDGSEANDWAYSDGSSEASLSSFLKAWQATTVGAPCLEPPITKKSCSKSDSFEAELFCTRLTDDPRFEPCRAVVDVEPYVSACKWDFCACEDKQSPESCACDSFVAFFRECTNKGGAVRGGWRSLNLCPMECERGFEYQSCMPAIQPRCGQAAETTKPEFCVEGCDCPSGLVLNKNGDCITPDSCPCTYHNKTYYSGDTIPNECNSCTCLSGEWVCTEMKCGSRCSSVGDPHYTTFDGRKYDFMGKCSYYLVKGGDFSIEAENTPCAGAISEVISNHRINRRDNSAYNRTLVPNRYYLNF